MYGTGDDGVRGFIVQPTYRVRAGRAQVVLFGRLETGESFAVRDDREVPHFFVRAAEARRAAELGARRSVETDLVTFAGEPVVRVELALPSDVPGLRLRLQAGGVRCYEADVGFATRYLIDRGIRGSLRLRGPGRGGGAGPRLYRNPALEPAEWTPRLTVLSLDIETDPQGERLLSVALHGAGASEVLLLAEGDAAHGPAGVVCFPDAGALLAGFCRRVRELDPDVLTGWRVADFDLATLARFGERLRVPLALGRVPGSLRLSPGRGRWRGVEASVPGRVVLDGPDLLRGAFVRLERFTLDHAARRFLGRGKTLSGSGRAEEILHLYLHDRARFVEYNLNDARLALEILERLRLVELAVERSRLTGMPLNRVSASIAAFDFLYLSALRRRRVVAPSVEAPARAASPTAGGEVLEPTPGLYEHVAVLDFRSLYPSIIRTFHIDPLGYLPHGPGSEDALVTPAGAAFRRQPGILPALLDELFPRRERARREGDEVGSHAIKILMNSFFGVLATPACRFYNSEVANAITGFGRVLLRWARDWIERRGHRVLYGDTDSLFVESGCDAAPAALELGLGVAADLNRALADHVRKTWGVESRLEIALAHLYLRLFLPATRHGGVGARKRYAGLVELGGRKEVVFTGMEAVRRDWTDLARRVQREVYQRFFLDEAVEPYLRRELADLRAGRLDELLVYRKALRKEAGEYTATTPPHVAAARKMRRQPPPRLVSYVMTTAGPEPATERLHPLDYRHYVERQVRAVCEPVLAHLGLSFERISGEDRQLDLF